MATTSKESDDKICNACIPKRTVAITSCHGCDRHFCRQHFNTHRDQLSKSLNDHIHLHNEIAQDLKTRIDQLNHQDAKRLLRDIDQWERRTIDGCRQAASEARNFVKESFDKTKENDAFLQRLTSIAGELEEQQRVENFIERDLERWMKQLKQLQKDINQTIKSPINAIIEKRKIDWKEMIQISLLSDAKQTVKHYVLVLGEKGAGKTTFIHYVANFFAKKHTFADRLPLKAIYSNKRQTFIDSDCSEEEDVVDQYSFPMDEQMVLVFLDYPDCDADEGELHAVRNRLGISKFAGIVMVGDGTNIEKDDDEEDFELGALFEGPDNLRDICNLCHQLAIIFVNCSIQIPTINSLKPFNYENISLYFMQNSAYQWYQSRSLTDSAEVDYHKSMETIEKIIKKILHEI